MKVIKAKTVQFYDRRMQERYTKVKRAIDVAISLTLLSLSWPIMLIIAIMVRLESPGAAIFRQKRLGKNGLPFVMYKFRNMYQNVPLLRHADGRYLVTEDDPRLTRVGRIIRACSLDELPQLWNVLKGEMSLVGPRPDPVEVLELYDEVMLQKLRVKPGVTGPVTVNGRNALSLRERAVLEAHYVENQSLMADWRIMLQTIAVVLCRRGAFNVVESRCLAMNELNMMD